MRNKILFASLLLASGMFIFVSCGKKTESADPASGNKAVCEKSAGRKSEGACKAEESEVKAGGKCEGACKAEDSEVNACTKCGMEKGSKDCCKAEGKERCVKCGLIKGSPGCCKAEGEKCEKIKGSAGCCK